MAEALEDGYSAYKRGDYPAAFRIFQSLAKQGFAQAQFALGTMYFRGHGVPKHETEAMKWFLPAALQGLAAAQRQVGMMYSIGVGVPKKDSESAVKWLSLAAKQNDATAQFSIGCIFRKGDGVPQSDSEAVKWYRVSALQGHTGGQNNLGFMYANGLGVEQDLTEAVNWYERAAAQGDKEGKLNADIFKASRPLWPLLSTLSEGDFSVLEFASQHSSSALRTAKGSANDVFWSEMENLGWAKAVPPVGKNPDDVPEDIRESFQTLQAGSKSFELTEAGQRAMNRLIGPFKKNRGGF